MAQRMVRSRADWRKAWTEDEVYSKFIADNPQYKGADKTEVVNAYLEQKDSQGVPLFESFTQSDGPGEYLMQTVSNIGPSAMKFAGETASGLGQLVGGGLRIAAGALSPFATPQARGQAISELANVAKVVPEVPKAVVSQIGQRLRGVPEAILSSAMPWNAGMAKQAAISPAAQSLRDEP